MCAVPIANSSKSNAAEKKRVLVGARANSRNNGRERGTERKKGEHEREKIKYSGHGDGGKAL